MPTVYGANKYQGTSKANKDGVGREWTAKTKMRKAWALHGEFLGYLRSKHEVVCDFEMRTSHLGERSLQMQNSKQFVLFDACTGHFSKKIKVIYARFLSIYTSPRWPRTLLPFTHTSAFYWLQRELVAQRGRPTGLEWTHTAINLRALLRAREAGSAVMAL